MNGESTLSRTHRGRVAAVLGIAAVVLAISAGIPPAAATHAPPPPATGVVTQTLTQSGTHTCDWTGLCVEETVDVEAEIEVEASLQADGSIGFEATANLLVLATTWFYPDCHQTITFHISPPAEGRTWFFRDFADRDKGHLFVDVVGTHTFQASGSCAVNGTFTDPNFQYGVVLPVSLLHDDQGILLDFNSVQTDQWENSTRTTVTSGFVRVGGDADGDALPDSWETDGLDLDDDGVVDLDLPAMGADPDHKDLFVEVDSMTGGRIPQDEIDKVIQAFRDAPVPNPDGVTGIDLHVDNGPSSPMNGSTPWGSMSDSDTVPAVSLGSIQADGSFDFGGPFAAIKNANFTDARRHVFFYAISMAAAIPDLSRPNANGSPGSSAGLAAGAPTADFIVTTQFPDAGTTFMHEFGHGLGLDHGGPAVFGTYDAEMNYKPNHFSVMNYGFPSGLIVSNGMGGGTEFLDFSRHSMPDLNEASLDETAGFGIPATHPSAQIYAFHYCAGGVLSFVDFGLVASDPVDWNCNGTVGGTVSVDINKDGVITPLKSFEEWSHLRYDGGGVIGALAVSSPLGVTFSDEPTIEELEPFLELWSGDSSDETAPVTTATASPNPSAAGWNDGPVTVELQATDEEGGSGVQDVTYSAAGAQAVPETTVPGDHATVDITAEGETTLTFFATDNAGNEEEAQTLVVRIDWTGPALTCSITPNRLWPPNHKLKDVQASVVLTDGLSGPDGFALTSVVSNEPDNGLGDGDTAKDIQQFAMGTPDLAGKLRAERSGSGSGRIYTLTYTGMDAAGNAAECSPTVEVAKKGG